MPEGGPKPKRFSCARTGQGALHGRAGGHRLAQGGNDVAAGRGVASKIGVVWRAAMPPWLVAQFLRAPVLARPGASVWAEKGAEQGEVQAMGKERDAAGHGDVFLSGTDARKYRPRDRGRPPTRSARPGATRKSPVSDLAGWFSRAILSGRRHPMKRALTCRTGPRCWRESCATTAPPTDAMAG